MADDNQNLEPILPTYDPKWESRHDAVGKELDGLQDQIKGIREAGQFPDKALTDREKELLSQLYDAFWAQFPTSSSLKAFYLEHLERDAAMSGRTLAYVEPRPNATADELHAWYSQAHDMLEEQHVLKLPVGQIEGVNGFQAPLPADAQRTSFLLKYVGWSDSSGETRCTMEQTKDRAYVCFHFLPNNQGTSPVNMIEDLASGIREGFLPHIAPQNVSFFIHIPPMKYDEERFWGVTMQWSRDRGYTDPDWNHYKQIPAAIREAETKPYDETPSPVSRAPAPAPHTPSKLSRLQGLFHRKRLGSPEI